MLWISTKTILKLHNKNVLPMYLRKIPSAAVNNFSYCTRVGFVVINPGGYVNTS
jgi:hypothetical protein